MYHHCIFDFRLEMSGLVLEIGFQYDKAIQIHRWANSIRVVSHSVSTILSNCQNCPYKTRFWIPAFAKIGVRVIIIKMTMSNGLSASINLSVEIEEVIHSKECSKVLKCFPWFFSSCPSVHSTRIPIQNISPDKKYLHLSYFPAHMCSPLGKVLSFINWDCSCSCQNLPQTEMIRSIFPVWLSTFPLGLKSHQITRLQN